MEVTEMERGGGEKDDYEDWLRSRYENCEGDMTVSEIADEAGVTYEAVRAALDRFDLLERSVECAVCGEEFKQITNTHLSKHGMTVEEYKESYPSSQIGSNQGWEDGLWYNNSEENPMRGKTGEEHHRHIEKQDLNCDNCGSSFERYPDQVRENNFCDRECYLEWHSVEDPQGSYGEYERLLKVANGSYRKNREAALKRDEYECRVCGRKENLHTHHVVPLRNGGSNFSYNLGVVCGSCHRSTVERPDSRYSEVSRKVEIDTGHRLYHHDWKCKNPHGHRYKIELTVGGLVNEEMMIADFGKLKDLMWDVLDEDIDHGMLLNEKDEEFIQLCQEKGWRHRTMKGDPTVENIADWLFDQFEEKANDEMEMYRARWRILSLKVWETPNCSVEVTRR
jgi:6-pyruvoyltetrahydropterin/6-carboxytetrahydropterin synthase